jgi:hypothetical protein
VRICETVGEWASVRRERGIYLLSVDYAGYLKRQLTLHLLNRVLQPFSLR